MVKDFRLPKQHKVFKLYKRNNLKTEGTNDLRRLFCTINRVHPTSYHYKYILQYCCWCPGTSLSNPNCVCNFLLSFFPQGKSFIFIMSEYIDGCSMTLLPWIFMSVQFRQKSECHWQSSSCPYEHRSIWPEHYIAVLDTLYCTKTLRNTVDTCWNILNDLRKTVYRQNITILYQSAKLCCDIKTEKRTEH